MRITAIVSMYNPQVNDIDNIIRISKLVDRIIVFDNSYKNYEEKFLNRNLKYIANLDNIGLSKGYNNVLDNTMYEWEDDEFVIFFDQDSSVEFNHIEQLKEIYNLLEKSGFNVGCLGPSYYNEVTKKIEMVHGKEVSKGIYSVSSIITSSMLTKYKVLKDIGFFNENIFIDYVDWDLCWRMKYCNLECFTTDIIHIKHNVGIDTKKIGNLRLRVWRPLRTYYQVRDGRYLLRQSYVPLMKRFQLIYMIYLLPLLNLIFIDNRCQRFQFMRYGLRDSQKGISGKFIEEQKR